MLVPKLLEMPPYFLIIFAFVPSLIGGSEESTFNDYTQGNVDVVMVIDRILRELGVGNTIGDLFN